MRQLGDVRVCKITYVFGDGRYTASEVARNAGDTAWDVLVAPSGLAGFTLREVNDSPALSVDDIVPFWRALGKGEKWRYLTRASLVIHSAPTDGQIPQYDAATGTWLSVAPAVVDGGQLIIQQTIRVPASTAAGQQPLDDTDLRTETIRVEGAYYGGVPSGNWQKFSWTGANIGYEFYTIPAAPGADIQLMSNNGMRLMIDAANGKAKWDWTNVAAERWLSTRIVVVNPIPDFTAS